MRISKNTRFDLEIQRDAAANAVSLCLIDRRRGIVAEKRLNGMEIMARIAQGHAELSPGDMLELFERYVEKAEVHYGGSASGPLVEKLSEVNEQLKREVATLRSELYAAREKSGLEQQLKSENESLGRQVADYENHFEVMRREYQSHSAVAHAEPVRRGPVICCDSGWDD